MSEEKTSKAEIIATSVEKISDGKGLEAIGKGFGIGLVALAVAALYFALTTGIKWDGHLYPQTKCFELQEVAGKVFKVNTCTGETVEFNSNSDIIKK